MTMKPKALKQYTTRSTRLTKKRIDLKEIQKCSGIEAKMFSMYK